MVRRNMAGKSTGNVERLIALAAEHFGKLNDYEMRVLRASGGDDCIVCQTIEFASGYGVPLSPMIPQTRTRGIKSGRFELR
jgi:hypothetical protein